MPLFVVRQVAPRLVRFGIGFEKVDHCTANFLRRWNVGSEEFFRKAREY